MHAQEALRNPRFEDFVYSYKDNSPENLLSWLGNGLTVAQMKDTSTTSYLDYIDIPPVINHDPRPSQNPQEESEQLVDRSASAANGLGREEKTGNIDVHRLEVARMGTAMAS